jgi:putative ABC transport system permease protein
MKTPLAWKNITHNKLRTVTSLAGVGFAILLIFMQLGFYDACFRSSTMVFDQLEFDIALVSPQYVHLRAAGAIPKRRLQQAKSVPGVETALPFYVGNGIWRNPENQFQREMLILGVDPREPTFRLAELAKLAPLLMKDDTVLVDVKAQKGYGKVQAGSQTELENRRIDVAGTYGYGSGFVADAGVIVSDRTLARLLPGYPLENVSIGLVKLKPGADRAAVIAAIKEKVGADRDDAEKKEADTAVWEREQLEKHEQDYFVTKKPLGIMFSSGVLLAFVVGAVILYQILASEIMNKLKEYATLKAMGYSNGYMNLVILQQATIYALLGFVPALLLSMGLYATTRYMVNLPMVMTPQRVAFVLALSIAMCSVSGLLASRKVSRADPADLF